MTDHRDDSEILRSTFEQPDIPDGWTIIGEGDAGGSYESNLLMFLISPDGRLMEQTSSHCSCYGHEGNWGPYMESGFCWGELADYVVVYEDWGISKGMKAGIDNYLQYGKPIVFRSIGR